MKSKVNIKNYENIRDVKAAIISAFQEMSNIMVTSIMEIAFQIKGGHFENKITMCLCVVCIRILMLSVHFEPKLMKIGRTRIIQVAKVDTLKKIPCTLIIFEKYASKMGYKFKKKGWDKQFF